jgi:CubicO group peptidase (beta-lactamase class C family)
MTTLLKNQLPLLRVMPRILSSLLLLIFGLSITSHSSWAHNGSIAYTKPITGIVLDGKLGDWPTETIRYRFSNVEVGVPMENNQDLSADFRMGYDRSLGTLFIAIEVIDQSMVMENKGRVNWDTHDGVEMYLDLNHHQSSSEITQYALYGPEKFIFGSRKNWDGVELKSSIKGNTRIYEWAIKLDQPLNTNKTIAFDLVVIDKDEDDSYTWISWGKRSQKLSTPNNCGDLVLAAEGLQLAQVTGNINYSKLSSDPVSIPVRFTRIGQSGMELQTRSDSTGSYSLELPVGEYQVDIPQEMMRIENDFYKIAPGEGVTFQVSNTTNQVPVLAPSQLPPPDLRPKQGVLHAFDDQQQARLEDYINTYMEFYKIPGVSLALIKDKQVVYHKTYGYKNATTKEPLGDETLFEAASITKPVFGFVVLRLAEKEIIDLDKPLYQYLPFDELEVTPEYKLMTARHVLIHRSGLPNWGVPLINTPGTEYGYSGEGFEYLKRVVEEITDKPVEQLLHEELINPLGLYHMEFKDSEALRKVAAIGHQGDHPTYWTIPKEPGMAHSMHTEAKAFSKFAIALLNQQGLEVETYAEMCQIHTESDSEWWDSQDYPEGAGLGVHVRKSPYGNVIGHGGNNGDFKCLFEVYQDLGMGYVVFTNSSMGDQLAADLSKFLVEGSVNLETAER